MENAATQLFHSLTAEERAAYAAAFPASRFVEQADINTGADYHADMAAHHRQAVHKDPKNARLHKRAQSLHHLAAGHFGFASIHAKNGTPHSGHARKALHFSQVAKAVSARIPQHPV
jgi:hypothetical protein